MKMRESHINVLVKEFAGDILENGLKAELDDRPGDSIASCAGLPNQNLYSQRMTVSRRVVFSCNEHHENWLDKPAGEGVVHSQLAVFQVTGCRIKA